MADFRGEKRDRSADKPEAQRPSIDDVRPPEPPKHKARKATHRASSDLQRFARDFKNGLGALNDAVDRLSKMHAPARGSTLPKVQPPKRSTQPAATTPAPKRTAQEIPKREQRKAPRAQHPVVRPKDNKDVDALIKTAKSQRSGRLPFVPKETRKKAEKLVAQLKKQEPRSLEAPKQNPRHQVSQVKPTTTARVVEAPKHPVTKPKRSTPAFPKSEFRKTKPTFPAQSRSAAPKKQLKEPEARKLEHSIPRFRIPGATTGPAIKETGESNVNVGGVNVMYHEGSKEAAQPEKLPLNNGAARRGAAADQRRHSTPTSDNPVSAAAPTSPTRTKPTAAVAATGGGSAGDSAQLGGERAVRLENATITMKDELGQQAIGELNARIVAIEGKLNV